MTVTDIRSTYFITHTHSQEKQKFTSFKFTVQVFMYKTHYRAGMWYAHRLQTKCLLALRCLVLFPCKQSFCLYSVYPWGLTNIFPMQIQFLKFEACIVASLFTSLSSLLLLVHCCVFLVVHQCHNVSLLARNIYYINRRHACPLFTHKWGPTLQILHHSATSDQKLHTVPLNKFKKMQDVQMGKVERLLKTNALKRAWLKIQVKDHLLI